MIFLSELFFETVSLLVCVVLEIARSLTPLVYCVFLFIYLCLKCTCQYCITVRIIAQLSCYIWLCDCWSCQPYACFVHWIVLSHLSELCLLCVFVFHCFSFYNFVHCPRSLGFTACEIVEYFDCLVTCLLSPPCVSWLNRTCLVWHLSACAAIGFVNPAESCPIMPLLLLFSFACSALYCLWMLFGHHCGLAVFLLWIFSVNCLLKLSLCACVCDVANCLLSNFPLSTVFTCLCLKCTCRYCHSDYFHYFLCLENNLSFGVISSLMLLCAHCVLTLILSYFYFLWAVWLLMLFSACSLCSLNHLTPLVWTVIVLFLFYIVPSFVFFFSSFVSLHMALHCLFVMFSFALFLCDMPLISPCNLFYLCHSSLLVFFWSGLRYSCTSSLSSPRPTPTSFLNERFRREHSPFGTAVKIFSISILM